MFDTLVQFFVLGITGAMFYMLNNKAALPQVLQIIEHFENKVADENASPVPEKKDLTQPQKRGEGKEDTSSTSNDLVGDSSAQAQTMSDHNDRKTAAFENTLRDSKDPPPPSAPAVKAASKSELPEKTLQFMRDYGMHAC